MNTERRYGWMWLRALELADEAERLQRRFLRYIDGCLEVRLVQAKERE